MDRKNRTNSTKQNAEALLSKVPRCTASGTRLCKYPQQLIHVHLSEVQTCRKDNVSLYFDDTLEKRQYEKIIWK